MSKNMLRGLGKYRTAGKFNVKPPKLGGGQGIKASSVIAKALGVTKGMPVHQASVKGLVSHPDANVASAARRLLKKY